MRRGLAKDSPGSSSTWTSLSSLTPLRPSRRTHQPVAVAPHPRTHGEREKDKSIEVQCASSGPLTHTIQEPLVCNHPTRHACSTHERAHMLITVHILLCFDERLLQQRLSWGLLICGYCCTGNKRVQEQSGARVTQSPATAVRSKPPRRTWPCIAAAITTASRQLLVELMVAARGSFPTEGVLAVAIRWGAYV